MNSRSEELVEGLVVNCYDEIGEKKSLGSQFPQTEDVLFTESELKIPEQNIEIPYSSIRDFRSLTDREGEKLEFRMIFRSTYRWTRTVHWRMILQDRTYFTLSKSNSAVGKAVSAGNIDVREPVISREIAERITAAIRQTDNQSVTYVPVDHLGIHGRLRVEGWTDGASEINAGIDATATTSGVSFGLHSDSVSAGASRSKSSISGDISGEISDNTYTTPIDSFLIFDDKLIIDSELRLELFYDEIDRVTAADQWLVIHVGETTYRAKVRNCKDELGEITKHITNQIDNSEDRNQEPDSSMTTPEKLRELKSLHEDGVISEDEFNTKKSDLLDEM